MQPCPDVGGELAALVAEREQSLEHRPAGLDLATPDASLARDPLRGLGEVTGNGRRRGPPFAHVVEGLSAQRARPGEREEHIPLDLGPGALGSRKHLEACAPRRRRSARR